MGADTKTGIALLKLMLYKGTIKWGGVSGILTVLCSCLSVYGIKLEQFNSILRNGKLYLIEEGTPASNPTMHKNPTGTQSPKTIEIVMGR